MDLQVLETQDRGWLHQILRPDPATHAYLLGDLDEPFFSQCRWLTLTQESNSAILLLYFGLSVPSLQAVGPSSLLPELFEQYNTEFPQRFHFKLALAELATLAEWVTIENHEKMWAMALTKETLQRPKTTQTTRLLTLDDAEAILEVYEDYPGHFFELSQLETNLYMGAWEGDTLVGVAGTHVFNLNERIAVLGNIVTRKNARGRGVAKASVGSLCQELFERGCDDVVLHVVQENHAAIACYKALGFSIHVPLVQGFAHVSAEGTCS